MTERERLTNLFIEAKRTEPDDVPFLEWLADFLLKNGVIVPPCKIGDTVFAFVDCFGVALPFLVEQIIIDYGKEKPHLTCCANCHDTENDELLADIDFEWKDIGKTVFFTYEEAKKVLKECEQK